jgi:hypothetical protein
MPKRLDRSAAASAAKEAVSRDVFMTMIRFEVWLCVCACAKGCPWGKDVEQLFSGLEAFYKRPADSWSYRWQQQESSESL